MRECPRLFCQRPCLCQGTQRRTVKKITAVVYFSKFSILFRSTSHDEGWNNRLGNVSVICKCSWQKPKLKNDWIRIHHYIGSTAFLENAIYCLIKLDIFAAVVHQKGTVSINNIQTQYPESPKCLKVWR